MSQKLTSMSVEALIKLRSEVGAILDSKAAALKKELAALGEHYDAGQRPMKGGAGTKTLLGTKVPPKYRGPGGVTWAGRGAMPVWMREAIKGGKKAEDFLIAKSPIPTARKKAIAQRKAKAKKKTA
jgi:DNA-binding protein H-NS